MNGQKFHVASRVLGGLVGVFCWLWMVVGVMGQEVESGEVHVLKLDVDGILAVPELWEMTPERLEELCEAEGFAKSPFLRWAAEESSGKRFAFFSRKPFTNVRVDGELFGGKGKMHTMVVEFAANRVVSAMVVMAVEGGVREMGEVCVAGLASWSGAEAQVGARWYGSVAVRDLRTWTYAGESATVCLDVGEKVDLVRFVLARPGVEPGVLLSQPVVELDRGALERFCDLGVLLSFPELWEMTPEALEAAFGRGMNGDILEFKWLDAERSAARFTRQPFSNVSVDLTLFPARLRVEEMVLNFRDGRAVNASVSLYNRGDGGEVSKEEFDVMFKKSGQALIEKLGARPVEYRSRVPTAVKTTSWLWNTPHTLALLEYNADALVKKSAAEFLRLRVAPVSLRDEFLNIAAIGQTTTTLGRGDLLKFVRKEANGDVLVTGIPMVDQGAKGYCVVASCERLFGYLNIPCDQHELASIAGSEADRGTNAGAFVEALRKINTRFKVRFKTLLEKMPMQVSEAREARPDRFAKMVQEEIDRGVPLLWALQLGLFPEEPDIAQQVGGGHMRLIIGYNALREEILFSDSWGAGHELKRMKLKDAVEATYGVYLVEPKGR